jgi:hypothetical protein
MSSTKILYGAYGANRDPGMLRAITGNASLTGKPAIFKDVELCVQGFDQIPDVVAPTAPVPLSPKAIMADAWGKKSGFETYAIRPAKGREVRGRVYKLTTEERALIAEWEMIEFGWYKEMDMKAVLEDGTEVTVNAEGLSDGASIDRVVDGMDYPTYLNDPTNMFKIAEQTQKAFLERSGPVYATN